MKPRVSVIIPNYNYALYLPQAIESALGQTYPNVEVLVVDDGSTDNSERVRERYGNRIRWVQQRNQGVAAARNEGVRHSSGEFVAFLDADDFWQPWKLERQVQRFVEDNQLGLVHCGVEEIDDSGAFIRLRLDGLEGWVASHLLLLKRSVILGGGSAVIVPRASFEAVGGFDPRLSTAADWDFFFQIAERWRVGFIPEPLVKYRVHSSNMHRNIKVMEHDMLLGFEKAFSSDNFGHGHLRRRSYGNLHMVLAGSFFRAGLLRDFARHALKSLWFTPRNVTHLFGFPLRQFERFRRALSSETSPRSIPNQR